MDGERRKQTEAHSLSLSPFLSLCQPFHLYIYTHFSDFLSPSFSVSVFIPPTVLHDTHKHKPKKGQELCNSRSNEEGSGTSSGKCCGMCNRCRRPCGVLLSVVFHQSQLCGLNVRDVYLYRARAEAFTPGLKLGGTQSFHMSSP